MLKDVKPYILRSSSSVSVDGVKHSSDGGTASNSDSDDGIMQATNRQTWQIESGSCEVLNSMLLHRNAILLYCEQRGLVSRYKNRKSPPETWFSPNPRIILIPRLYNPFQSYPVQSNGSHFYFDMLPGEDKKTFRKVLSRLSSRETVWIDVRAEVKSALDKKRLLIVSDCYNSEDKMHVPFHVFDSTTMWEMSNYSIDENYRAMYSGLTESTLHSGIYGSLHDNTIVDIRPYEENDDGPLDPKNEYDSDLRTVREDLVGFLDFNFTTPNQEAGKLRSFCHGCYISHPLASTFYFLSDVFEKIFYTKGYDACYIRNSAAIEHKQRMDILKDRDEIEARLYQYSSNYIDPWVIHYSGIVGRVAQRKVVDFIVNWLLFNTRDRPNLHIFPAKRVISFATSPGCVLKLVECVDSITMPKSAWVDSLVFNDDIMMEVYGYKRPPLNELNQYSKSFMSFVPYWCYNQAPRPLYASSISPQALCRPRVEVISTSIPIHVSVPVIRTPLVTSLCSEMSSKSSIPLSFPGHHLLVAFINSKDNYEDSVILSQKVNDWETFAHEGYIAHPIPDSVTSVKKGQVLERESWIRPIGSITVLSKGINKNKTSYFIGKIVTKHLMVGDKLATQHGQKFTISKILPEDQMPLCRDTRTGETFKPHIVVASSSIHNRGTVGQIYEAWKTFETINSYDFNPLSLKSHVDMSPSEMFTKPNNCYTCNFTSFSGTDFVSRKDDNGLTTLCIADYGICNFWLLGHLTRDKQLYLSKAPRAIKIPKGRLKGGSVRLGEMEIITLYMKGMIFCLSELLESYDQVEVSVCDKCRRLSILCDCTGKCIGTSLVSTRYSLNSVLSP
ncbi:hypothetical protein HDV06_000806 [Boothiomyces sp. JEL0866]|nr:hypothetical protein HDV06_000806 [Boothiomyces sp. JEL0866]